MSEWSCGVSNCGNGKCVHKLLEDVCPYCGGRLVYVETTEAVFCSTHEAICEYETDTEGLEMLRRSSGTFTPPADYCVPDLVDQINKHLNQLPPHVKERDSAKLLTAARIEIDKLRSVIQKAKQHGEASENPFYEMMKLLNENS